MLNLHTHTTSYKTVPQTNSGQRNKCKAQKKFAVTTQWRSHKKTTYECHRIIGIKVTALEFIWLKPERPMTKQTWNLLSALERHTSGSISHAARVNDWFTSATTQEKATPLSHNRPCSKYVTYLMAFWKISTSRQPCVYTPSIKT